MIFAVSLALMSTSFVNGALPPNHHAAFLNDFAGRVRCPYASEWLSKGPRQAAIDLGLMGNKTTAIITSTPKNVNHRRYLQPQEQETVSGSCVFTNEFSKQESCIQMVDSWTLENMETRCSENSGTLSVGIPCALPPSLAGWCHVSDENNVVVESMPLPLTDGMGCDGIKGACETFMSGMFQPDGDCMEVELDSTECDIAPGPIGAAHQAGFSSGYHNNCPGTPAEGSVYMWPIRWTAETKLQSMAFGSDDVLYTSTGRVYYRMDKNWKRSDTFSEKGNMRFGFAPCPNEDNAEIEEETGGCHRDHNERSTMIHRGSKMFFIGWKNGTVTDHPENISNCTWLDLSVVGNVRPDWFMDKRGSSTDVQYLGNQHIFHDGQPRLVRQWRKTDFANMFFVMSMLENPGSDGIHWPMVLNIPGEGFGDDSLQIYTNHSILTDAHDDLFLLDQALEGIGGSCPQMVRDQMEGGGGDGFSSKEIPSNLEVDENAWFSNEVTFSPVWEPPTHAGSVAMGSSISDDLAVTNVGPATISSCYDSDMAAVHLSFTFTEVDAGNLPWIAIGYRESEECRMIPADGSDTPIILLGIDPATGEGMAAKGSLPAAARQMDGDSIAGIYRGLVPLDEVEGYSNVMIELPNPATATARSVDRSDDAVTFSFSQSTEGKEPSTMHLMYAIGSTPQLGYHSVRNCFEVKEFPSCAAEEDHEESVAHMTNSGTANNQYYFMISFAITIAVVSQLFMIV